MNKKLFLTSFIAFGVATPVFAVPSHSGEFPNDGLMKEDYTYINAATSTNMAGVYEGTVDAVAQYTDTLYQIAAGQYLPAGSEQVINCDQSGYFCPGVVGNVNYDEDNAQGLTSCSTATNGDYTLSDGTGSTADTCYRTCSGNVTIEHATAVTGNDYYGNGVDTCSATACENGWHVQSGSPNLTSLIGEYAGESYGYVNNSGTPTQTEQYGITDKNSWVVDYGSNGILTGHGRCSTRVGTAAWSNGFYNFISDNVVTDLTDETGQNNAEYCYCQIDSYKPVNSDSQSVSTPWIFVYHNDDAETCANRCAYRCGSYLQQNTEGRLSFRSVIFGSIEPTLARCEANIININWNHASQEAINANNAGTATYNSDIRTPQSAEHVSGKRFTGWRFVKPTQTTLP